MWPQYFMVEKKILSHDLVFLEKDHMTGFNPEELKNRKLIKSFIH